MKHLSLERIEALLAGRLEPEREAELAAHLAEGGCPTCERALAQLDPELERRLLDLLARTERVDRGESVPPAAARALRARAWTLRPWAWASAGAVACALVLVALWPSHEGEDRAGQRSKGPAAEPGAVELTLGVVSDQPAIEARVRPVNPDEPLAPERTLLFRVSTAADGCYLYLLQRAGARVTVLWPASLADQRPMPAGNHDLQRGGKPLGLPLSDSRGPQVFLALCSLAPIGTEADLRALLPPGGRGAPGRAPAGVSWDYARVTVAAPGQDR